MTGLIRGFCSSCLVLSLYATIAGIRKTCRNGLVNVVVDTRAESDHTVFPPTHISLAQQMRGHWEQKSRYNIHYYYSFVIEVQKKESVRGNLSIDWGSGNLPYLYEEGINWGDFLANMWMCSDRIRSDKPPSRVQLSATPWITARQASLSITSSRSSLRLTSIESAMPSSHLILCRPPLLLPPIPPSIRVFSNESTLGMRWPKYWSFSFSIIPSKEIPFFFFLILFYF